MSQTNDDDELIERLERDGVRLNWIQNIFIIIVWD